MSKESGKIDGLVNLHEHLGGGAPAKTLWKAGNDMGFKFQSKNFRDFEKSLIVTDNSSYFQAFHLTEKIQSNGYGMELCVYSVFEEAYLSGVDYLELRFNPLYRTVKNVFDMDKIIHGAIIGMQRAKSMYGIKGGLIFCMDRVGDDHLNNVILEKAVKYQDRGVVGIDVAGKETKETNRLLFEKFYSKYEKAKICGLRTTMHIGECNYEGLDKDAMPFLEGSVLDRIGHGIHLLQFDDIVHILGEESIPLEICPSSNISNGYVESVDDVVEKIEYAIRYNIPVAVSTDSTQLLQTSVKREIKILEDSFPPGDILKLNTLHKGHLFSKN